MEKYMVELPDGEGHYYLAFTGTYEECLVFAAGKEKAQIVPVSLNNMGGGLPQPPYETNW